MAVGIDTLRQGMATLGKENPFAPERIADARSYLEAGRPLVAAIEGYRQREGRWPRCLRQAARDRELSGWSYSLRPDGGFQLICTQAVGYVLYFEPAHGWLMARDADTLALGR
jgi:hypothetical protein